MPWHPFDLTLNERIQFKSNIPYYWLILQLLGNVNIQMGKWPKIVLYKCIRTTMIVDMMIDHKGSKVKQNVCLFTFQEENWNIKLLEVFTARCLLRKVSGKIPDIRMGRWPGEINCYCFFSLVPRMNNKHHTQISTTLSDLHISVLIC
jgi:hypothetical protein